MKTVNSLTEREILALAIAMEEEDERVYADFAEAFRVVAPSWSTIFERVRLEEATHRERLFALIASNSGDHVPLVRRQDVTGFVSRKPLWLMKPIQLDRVRRQADAIELETRRFYEQAAARARDADARQLFDDLAEEEHVHSMRLQAPGKESHALELRPGKDRARQRLFVLQIVQPGLEGLMDGSVSTLAPVFAAALATKTSWDAFLVGLAASLGAGISMGFAEALSDDGKLTGRGHPWVRGVVCGGMTTLGGIGHTLPFMISNFHLAMVLAFTVVVLELAVITWIRHRYMDTPTFSAALQVGLGGALVFATGVLIGSS